MYDRAAGEKKIRTESKFEEVFGQGDWLRGLPCVRRQIIDIRGWDVCDALIVTALVCARCGQCVSEKVVDWGRGELGGWRPCYVGHNRCQCWKRSLGFEVHNVRRKRC
jgi:hypothetical protein